MTSDHLIRLLSLPNIISSWLERILDYDNMTSNVRPMLIALIAVFFPLVLTIEVQIIHRYKSTTIVKTFNQSKTIKLYFYTLLTSIIFYILSIIKIQFPGLSCKSSSHFYSVVLAIGTALLLGLIPFIMHIVNTYFDLENLILYLKLRYNKSANKNKILYRHAISSILNYTISTGQVYSMDIDSTFPSIVNGIYKFFGYDMKMIKQVYKNKVLEFDDDYYKIFHHTNRIICTRKSTSPYGFGNLEIFTLFIDLDNGTTISDKTYKFFLDIIIESINNDCDIYVTKYWIYAHQYYEIYARSIGPEFNSTLEEIVNKNEKEKREKRKEKFLEFHYTLGGLILYKQRYGLLKQIMSHTNTLPPRYYLVPELMQTVMEQYIITQKHDYKYYTNNYYIEGIAGETVRQSVQRYISLLFIRQFTLPEVCSMKRTSIVNLPTSNEEIEIWRASIQEMEDFVSEYLAKPELLSELGLTNRPSDNEIKKKLAEIKQILTHR